MMGKFNLSSDVFSISPMETDEGFSETSLLTGKGNSNKHNEKVFFKDVIIQKIHRTRQRAQKETKKSDKGNIDSIRENAINNVHIEHIPSGLV